MLASGRFPISLWDFLLVLSGSLIAIALVPHYDYIAPGRLSHSGIALSLGLLLPMVRAAIVRLDAIFTVEYLILFGLVFWVTFDAAQGAYGMWGISRAAIITVYISITVFAIAMLATSVTLRYFKFRLIPSWSPPITGSFLFFAIIFCFFCGMATVFLSCGPSISCFVDGILAPRFASVWRVVQFGNWDTFLLRLRLLGYLILPLVVLLRHMEGRTSWRVVFGIILGIIFLLMLVQGGGRRQVGVIIGATIMVWLVINRPLNWRHVVRSVLAVVVLITLMEAMLTWRNEGIGALFESKVVDNSKERPGLIHIDRNLYYFALLEDIVPAREAHTGWLGVYSIVASTIPGSILPNKPLYNVIDIRNYLYWFRPATWNWTCSAVCEFYLIGGVPIVFLGGILFGVFAYFGNGLLERRGGLETSIIYGVYVMTLFIDMRALREILIIGLVVVGLYSMFYMRKVVLRKWRQMRLENV